MNGCVQGHHINTPAPTHTECWDVCKGITQTLPLAPVPRFPCAGRRPFTQGLGLENVGLATDSRGRIEVDDHFRTKVRTKFINEI